MWAIVGVAMAINRQVTSIDLIIRQACCWEMGNILHLI